MFILNGIFFRVEVPLMVVVLKFIPHCHHCDVNRACVGFPKRWCHCRSNVWFTLRTKFKFKL